jgi:adenosine deaminase
LNDRDSFIRSLPKAELHIHIEGSLEPELAFELARKHGVKLPYDSVEALRRAYDFADLQSFLDVYYAVAGVLRDEDDFFALTWAYLQRVRDDGAVHVEIFFDPQTHTARGIPYATALAGITRALDKAQATLGISSRLILCFLRHLSADEAMRTLEEALPAKERLAGVGLDSSEKGHPPSKFAEVFRRARAAGLAAVAHAGEEGPPSYIVEALDLLHVSRIDHGVRCEEDTALCERLAAEQVPLTVCPLSNVKLCVFQTMRQHNLKRLLDRGMCITLNSDDPAYFGGYLLANYTAAADALDLDRDDIVQLCKNSFTASFLDEGAKRTWISRIDEHARNA